MPKNSSVYLSAISNSQGEVDAGYLAMAWALVGWFISTLSILGIGGYAVSATKDHAASIQAIGIALGAVSGGFATVLGAVGIFRWGDKQHPNSAATVPVP
jgi:hypothetical protein